MKKLLFAGWLLLFVLAAGPGRAQGEFNTWCFGYNIGPSAGPPTNTGTGAAAGEGTGIQLQFGPAGPVRPVGVCNNSYWNAGLGFFNYGTASISDALGNFLFFTTGLNVRDRRNQQMPNGDLQATASVDWWGGEAGFQPAAIAPGTNGLYYLFHWNKGAPEAGQNTFALSYSVVDMRLNGGYGDVTQKNTVLGRTSRARLTVVRHANNRDFWVLTRDLDTRGFQAFLLTRQGMSTTPVVSMAGQALYPDMAELKAAPNGRRLACGALVHTNGTPQGCVCVYDFDNATGVVAHEVVVRRTTVPEFPSVAGRPQVQSPLLSESFSPDSRLLYTTEVPVPLPTTSRRWSDVWQYDLSQPTEAAIAQSRFLVSNVPPLPAPNDVMAPHGLQLAPDGTLWISAVHNREIVVPGSNPTVFGAQASAIVRQPNVAGAGCSFVPEGFLYLPGQTTAFFPNVITSMLYAPAVLNYEAGCPEDSVQFWASSAGDPAGLRWDFGEPASGAANAATGPQAAHRYAQGGTYAVRLTLADGRVLTQAVTVTGAAADFTDENIFTPNGDGQNDLFTPVRSPLPGGHLRVYSRWGQAVFSTDAPALRWDGAGATAGDYFYQLDYLDCQGGTRHRRGTLTLVR
jgi:gliding motility-associated-like protein